MDHPDQNHLIDQVLVSVQEANEAGPGLEGPSLPKTAEHEQNTHVPQKTSEGTSRGPCQVWVAGEFVRLAQIYGQGEAPMTITGLSKTEHADRQNPRWRSRMQSAGFPRTDVEVRVIDAEGHELPPGEEGEVVVRGGVVMAGYWQRPEATAVTLRDGWLHTGDIGVFDDDGCLTLHDRSKDLIISGGLNIYPREVEEALLNHPHVEAVAVVGRPDPEWGEAVVAFVVTDGVEPPTEELERTCLERIARFKRPKDYRFVDSLPTSNYGKILKRELREWLRDDSADPEA